MIDHATFGQLIILGGILIFLLVLLRAGPRGNDGDNQPLWP